jgi:alkylated DNA repair dioxygenase AlkB
MAQEEHIPLKDGGHLTLIHDWVPPEEAAGLFLALEHELPWRQETFKMGGWEVTQPRLTCWHGDPGAQYTYSRRTFEPSPWTPTLSGVRDRLNAESPVPFNSALGNLYRHGQDSMGCHADNEPELGDNPVIASLSLGGTRRFALHHHDKSVPRVALDLPDGSLLWMTGTTQHFWQHSVTKTKRQVTPRINLTFRAIRDLPQRCPPAP